MEEKAGGLPPTWIWVDTHEQLCRGGLVLRSVKAARRSYERRHFPPFLLLSAPLCGRVSGGGHGLFFCGRRDRLKAPHVSVWVSAGRGRGETQFNPFQQQREYAPVKRVTQFEITYFWWVIVGQWRLGFGSGAAGSGGETLSVWSEKWKSIWACGTSLSLVYSGAPIGSKRRGCVSSVYQQRRVQSDKLFFLPKMHRLLSPNEPK